jgi:hypothetical protein
MTGLLLLGLTALPAADDPPRFSDWSTPVEYSTQEFEALAGWPLH